MKKALIKYCCAFILVVYALLFLVIKQPQQEWDRVINSDGKAYYAYLTGIFIYHDLQFNFVELYESAYYPDDRSAFKEFRIQYNDRIVNKAFPGQALLWLPFFLLAHLITLMTDLPADGYSIIYQYLIGFSAIVYLWLGCYMLRKLLLSMGTPEGTASFISLVIVMGTNLLYYTINEGTMTHTYSFAVITSLFYCFTLILRQQQLRWLPLAGALFGLAVIIRPVNALLLLTIPFWAGSQDHLSGFFQSVKARLKLIVPTILITLAVCAIPVILWYLQTGKPIVYSYGDEYFDFTHPRIGKLLWSYEKGWFVYTPVALLSFFGLIPVFRSHKAGFFSLLVFWLAFIYVSSCWWIWDYTSRFSQRIFIDFLGLTGVMLYYFMAVLLKNRIFQRLAIGALILLVSLNIFQYYQCWKWVYPKGPVSGATYWKYFFQTKPMASVQFPPEEDILSQKSFLHDMESDNGWLNPASYVDVIAHSGMYSSRTGVPDTIGTGIDKLLQPLLRGEKAVVIVSGWIYSSSPKVQSSIIVDLLTNGMSYYYRTFALNPYLKKGSWTFVQFQSVIPRLQTDLDRIKVYSVNYSAESPVYLDDMRVDFISLKATHDPVPAIVNIPDKLIASSRIIFNDMESDSIGAVAPSISNEMSMAGLRSSRIGRDQPFSVGIREKLRSAVPSGDPMIRVSAYIHTDADTSKTFLVADFSSQRQTFLYRPLSLAPYLEEREWAYVEFLIFMPDVVEEEDEVLIYFWNPSATEVAYIDNLEIEFFTLNKAILSEPSRVDSRDILSIKAVIHDMEQGIGWKNEGTLTGEKALFGNQSCRISPEQPFSVSLQTSMDPDLDDHGMIRVSAYVLSDVRNSAVSLVTDFRRDGRSYMYQPYYMNNRTRYLEWEYIEFTTFTPPDRRPGDELFIYFWNSSKEEIFYIDNMSIEFLTLRD